jgi:hypothetical protein
MYTYIIYINTHKHTHTHINRFVELLVVFFLDVNAIERFVDRLDIVRLYLV